MILTGTITETGQASEPSGQFNVRYQDITITDPNGRDFYGRIGSKQGYQENTPISVTVEEKQGENGPYNYFRKHNPQYADRAAPQRSQQRASQPPKSPQNNKDRLIVAQVVYKELSSKFADVKEFDIWIMGDGHNVLSRHIDSIMLLGSYKTADGEPNF